MNKETVKEEIYHKELAQVNSSLSTLKAFSQNREQQVWAKAAVRNTYQKNFRLPTQVQKRWNLIKIKIIELKVIKLKIDVKLKL